jgi:hypothetical protein
MAIGVGSSACSAGLPCPSPANSSATSVASLQGRIRQDKTQLDDWTTCVSSKTAKGQSAIQKLSGEISATKERIARVLQSQSQEIQAPAAAMPGAQSARATSSTPSTSQVSPGRVDVWA